MKFNEFIEITISTWRFMDVRIQEGVRSENYVIVRPQIDVKRQVITGEFYKYKILESSNPKDRYPVEGMKEIPIEAIIGFGKPDYIYNDNRSNPFKKKGIKLKNEYMFDFESCDCKPDRVI